MSAAFFRQFLAALILVLPMKLVAQQNKELLPYDPKLVSFDAEKDSIRAYRDSPWIKRLFKPTIFEHCGIAHILYDYEPNSKLVLKTGIEDSNGRVYWIDNEANLLTVYKNGALLWKFHFGNSGVGLWSEGHIYRFQLFEKQILLTATQCWLMLNRETGADEGGGCD